MSLTYTNLLLKILLVFCLNNLSATALAEEISGIVKRVKDGDSIFIWNSEIRLLDIDAFEYTQECVKNKRTYRCGQAATEALKKLIINKKVLCRGDQADRYNRLLATCFVGKVNVNQEMVRLGWAVNYNKGMRYLKTEKQAKQNRRGAWQGSFIDPLDYRRRTRTDKRAEQKFARSKSANQACDIKGNISSTGAKIYHTPWGSDSYSKTKISTRHGERWFCSEREAEAAGWRAPHR